MGFEIDKGREAEVSFGFGPKGEIEKDGKREMGKNQPSKE